MVPNEETVDKGVCSVLLYIYKTLLNLPERSDLEKLTPEEATEPNLILKILNFEILKFRKFQNLIFRKFGNLKFYFAMYFR